MHYLHKTGNGTYQISSITSLQEISLSAVDIVVTGAHQDDEAFTYFYQLPAIQQGKKVGAVVVTDGAGMNYCDASGCTIPLQEVIEMRNQESISAAREVGLEFLLLLNYPSVFVKSKEGQHQLASDIGRILKQTHPEATLTHSPYDDHPTHLKVAEAVISGARDINYPGEMWGYAVWGSLLGRELGFGKGKVIDIAPDRIKQASVLMMKHFPSQVAANPYDQVLEARARFQHIMFDAHQAATPEGYKEFFVDYTPLTKGIFQGTFAEYVPVLLRLEELKRAGVQLPDETIRKWANGILLDQVRALQTALIEQ